MKLGSKDPSRWDITDAEISFWGPHERNEGGMVIRWGTKGAGFGEFTVWSTSDGRLECHT